MKGLSTSSSRISASVSSTPCRAYSRTGVLENPHKSVQTGIARLQRLSLLVLMVRRLVANIAPGSSGVTRSESNESEADGEGILQVN